MPQEFHRIVFSIDEVVRAVSAFRRTHADFLPPGAIRRHALAGQKLTLAIEMSYAGNNQLIEFTLDSRQLLEPLIKFCAENNIGVPRADRRRLKVGERDVTMEMVAVNEAGVPIAAMAGQPPGIEAAAARHASV